MKIYTQVFVVILVCFGVWFFNGLQGKYQISASNGVFIAMNTTTGESMILDDDVNEYGQKIKVWREVKYVVYDPAFARFISGNTASEFGKIKKDVNDRDMEQFKYKIEQSKKLND